MFVIQLSIIRHDNVFWYIRKILLMFISKLTITDTNLLILFSITYSKDPGYVKRPGDLGTQSDTEVRFLFMLFVYKKVACQGGLSVQNLH